MRSTRPGSLLKGAADADLAATGFSNLFLHGEENHVRWLYVDVSKRHGQS
jgi:hypothetical protein